MPGVLRQSAPFVDRRPGEAAGSPHYFSIIFTGASGAHPAFAVPVGTPCDASTGGSPNRGLRALRCRCHRHYPRPRRGDGCGLVDDEFRGLRSNDQNRQAELSLRIIRPMSKEHAKGTVEQRLAAPTEIGPLRRTVLRTSLGFLAAAPFVTAGARADEASVATPPRKNPRRQRGRPAGLQGHSLRRLHRRRQPLHAAAASPSRGPACARRSPRPAARRRRPAARSGRNWRASAACATACRSARTA